MVILISQQEQYFHSITIIKRWWKLNAFEKEQNIRFSLERNQDENFDSIQGMDL